MDGIGQPHYAASPTRPSHCCHASIPDNVTFSRNDNVLSHQHGIIALKGGCENGRACRIEWNRTTNQISGYWHTSEKPVLEISTNTAQLLTPLLLSSIPLFTILQWTNTIALSGGIVSEEALDLSSDRLLMMLNQHSRSPLMSQLTNLCPVTSSRHVHSYRCSTLLQIRHTDAWLRRRFYEIYWLVETIASIKGTVFHWNC